MFKDPVANFYFILNNHLLKGDDSPELQKFILQVK